MEGKARQGKVQRKAQQNEFAHDQGHFPKVETIQIGRFDRANYRRGEKRFILYCTERKKDMYYKNKGFRVRSHSLKKRFLRKGAPNDASLNYTEPTLPTY